MRTLQSNPSYKQNILNLDKPKQWKKVPLAI